MEEGFSLCSANATATTTTTTQQQQPSTTADDASTLPSSSYVLDIGCAQEFHITQLQNIHPLITHKQHELSVYTNARRLIETRDAGERCMVFLADNVFVQTTREQALGILQRQIEVFQNSLHQLEQERDVLEQKVRVMGQLQINEEGLVEIRESVEYEYPLKNKEKRIAHISQNRVDIDENKDEKQIKTQSSQRPKGVSDEDFKKFVELVNSYNLSDDDQEDKLPEKFRSAVDEKESTEKERRHNGIPLMRKHEKSDRKSSSGKGMTGAEDKRHVHFSEQIDVKSFNEREEEQRTKSILRNRSEQSPIDADQVKKMEDRGIKRIVSVSTETLGNNIFEIKGEPERKLREMPNKRQNDKNRPVSRWKAERMNLPIRDEDEDGY